MQWQFPFPAAAHRQIVKKDHVQQLVGVNLCALAPGGCHLRQFATLSQNLAAITRSLFVARTFNVQRNFAKHSRVFERHRGVDPFNANLAHNLLAIGIRINRNHLCPGEDQHNGPGLSLSPHQLWRAGRVVVRSPCPHQHKGTWGERLIRHGRSDADPLMSMVSHAKAASPILTPLAEEPTASTSKRGIARRAWNCSPGTPLSSSPRRLTCRVCVATSSAPSSL